MAAQLQRRPRIQYVFLYLFLVVLLLLAQVQALDQSQHQSVPQTPRPGQSFHHHWRSGGRDTSKQNPSRRSTSRASDLELYVGRAAATVPYELPSIPPTPELTRGAMSMKLEHTPSRHEVEALRSFRDGITGGNLSMFNNWGVNDSTPCGWTGVSCSVSGDHSGSAQVTELNASSHKLQGSISSALLALGKLRRLRKLDLSNNNFSSSILGASLLNFSGLAHLNLSHNLLEGGIPEQIGELVNLQSLAFQSNYFQGPIPRSLVNCTSLRVLNLQENVIHSEIPPDIGKLFHLEVLVLGNWLDYTTADRGRRTNSISGTIPPSLGNCSSLVVFDVNLSGDLGGELPHELSQLHKLQVLSLTNCGFGGVIPRWIGNLTDFIEFHGYDNRFYGPLPAEFGMLRNFSWLSVGECSISGDFPPEIANCTFLTRLRISDTSITGVFPPELANCSLLIDFEFTGNSFLAPAPTIPPWLSTLRRLQAINLETTNRIGSIPSELGMLSKLRYMQISDGPLVGSIPPGIFNLSSLVYLEITNCSLTGHLSPSIGLLANLQYVYLDKNLLSGPVSLSVTNLTLIILLDISENYFRGTLQDIPWGLSPFVFFYFHDNDFVGSIPTAFGNCSNLIGLNMDGNHLTGEIPASLGNLSNLAELHVARNLIRGEIPEQLGRCQILATLDLGSNELHGLFPQVLGHLPFLTALNLSHNDFAGTVETFVRNLSHILFLDLSYNQFNGSFLPESLSSLRHVVSMNISHNRFSGNLSRGLWTSLQDVQEIDISANQISGTIPDPGTSSSSSLQRLDMSSNNLSGNIPESLASLLQLIFLNVSYNNLEGPIPAFNMSNSSITATSFEGNAGLCGAVLGPSRECPSPKAKCKFFLCARTLAPVLVGGVAIFALILALAAWVMKRWLRNRRKKVAFDILVSMRPSSLKYTPTDILAIIRDEKSIISSSAKSVVYRNKLPGRNNVIAFKVFNHHSHERYGTAADWNTSTELYRDLIEREASLQAGLRHRNVLKILSFCSHSSFTALLLEYVSRGSLHDHLYPDDEGPRALGGGKGPSERRCQLSWSTRLGIAIDVAEGVTYLHHECRQPLIHGDLKPSNILLDEDMVAKVSDFGISKLVNPQRARQELAEQQGEATASRICGTFGYMPPEYAFVAVLSTKGDVFSYGTVLLEMLSGSPPAGTNYFGEANYRDQILQHFQNSPIEVLDPTLQKEGRMDALKLKQMVLLAKVGFFCTRATPQSRPSMRDVRSMLLQINRLEEGGSSPRRTVSE